MTKDEAKHLRCGDLVQAPAMALYDLIVGEVRIVHGDVIIDTYTSTVSNPRKYTLYPWDLEARG